MAALTDLFERLCSGDRSAVADALNLVDDRRPGPRAAALELLARLEGKLDGTKTRIGLTGAPGAGKSTLVDALVRRLRRAERTVGVIAVDPSSQRSGGALLGDRIRVRTSARDPGVFFRSMAARDRLGGLAEGARAAVTVLESVFDVVLVETVGVGQSEGEVSDLVDTLVYVAQPGAGDLLQFMKAGILELPDIFAVNKADIGPSATRTASELDAGVGLGERPGAWRPPVVTISARDGIGLELLDDALAEHRAYLDEGRRLATRRRSGRDAYVRDALLHRYGSHGIEAIGGVDTVATRLAERPEASGFALATSLANEIEEALAKPVSPIKPAESAE